MKKHHQYIDAQWTNWYNRAIRKDDKIVYRDRFALSNYNTIGMSARNQKNWRKFHALFLSWSLPLREEAHKAETPAGFYDALMKSKFPNIYVRRTMYRNGRRM